MAAPGWLSMGDPAWLSMGDPGWLSFPDPGGSSMRTAKVSSGTGGGTGSCEKSCPVEGEIPSLIYSRIRSA
jgi:hypothetical protein